MNARSLLRWINLLQEDSANMVALARSEGEEDVTESTQVIFMQLFQLYWSIVFLTGPKGDKPLGDLVAAKAIAIVVNLQQKTESLNF